MEGAPEFWTSIVTAGPTFISHRAPRTRRIASKRRTSTGCFATSETGHFADVTAQAGLVENAFSQGVAIGDVDNDGFPDIYVGNIGSNRLFLNNGDGTFSDATEESGAGDSTWTSSCVIADLNGDSLPDIYTVGFVQGDALTRICNNQKKRLDACLPLEFPQAKSHLWLNRGDGRFEDASASSGIDLPNGKGTAVVAADLDGSGKLDLLVGNDGNPELPLQERGRQARGPAAIFRSGPLFRVRAAEPTGHRAAAWGWRPAISTATACSISTARAWPKNQTRSTCRSQAACLSMRPGPRGCSNRPISRPASGRKPSTAIWTGTSTCSPPTATSMTSTASICRTNCRPAI